VAAALTLHARRITLHLSAAADKWLPTLLKGLPKLTALELRSGKTTTAPKVERLQLWSAAVALVAAADS